MTRRTVLGYEFKAESRTLDARLTTAGWNESSEDQTPKGLHGKLAFIGDRVLELLVLNEVWLDSSEKKELNDKREERASNDTLGNLFDRHFPQNTDGEEWFLNGGNRITGDGRATAIEALFGAIFLDSNPGFGDGSGPTTLDFSGVQKAWDALQG